MEITLKVAGAKPLLLASIGAADPRSWAYQKMQELPKVKSANRTAKWYDEMAHVQFASAFYVIPDVKGVGIPAENVRRSLIEAAKATREKPRALRAIKAVEVAIPIMFEGGRTAGPRRTCGSSRSSGSPRCSGPAPAPARTPGPGSTRGA
jgi:hypothetical protein